jgi:hypothetical protein
VGTGGAATVLAGVGVVDPHDPAHAAVRAAAVRGGAAERFVVLADRTLRSRDDVRALTAADEAAGVTVRFVDAADHLDVEPPGGSLDFALWDDEVVLVRGEPRDDARTVAAARRAVAALRAAADGPADPARTALEVAVDEPLLAGATVARALALERCRPVGPGVGDCAPYHGHVLDFRLLGLVSAPGRHGRFYRETLAAQARAGRRRVLIPGAVDFSMLAHVLAAYAEAGVTPEVMVTDRCPSPLALNAWHAGRAGIPVATATANAVDQPGDAAYDVIVSDGVLPMMDPADQRRAVWRWRDLLAPGGRAITLARIRPGSPAGPQRFTPESIAGFRAAVRREAERRRGLHELEPAELEAAAERYAAAIAVWPTPSAEAFVAMFAAAGLRLEAVDTPDMPGWGSGPGTVMPATYVRVVAVRE